MLAKLVHLSVWTNLTSLGDKKEKTLNVFKCIQSHSKKWAIGEKQREGWQFGALYDGPDLPE